ncbi:MAG: hypothetical protein H6953_08810 [Chromatiaceae bacterium]|nr:hypothetical protein [Gammaproteobacteria bacterium]MCP5305536.1 hypothetical protein [Chromatiaceae bacterium]MCP5315495.1 hypothetical protein [Chromatiaceae bacterium]
MTDTESPGRNLFPDSWIVGRAAAELARNDPGVLLDTAEGGGARAADPGRERFATHAGITLVEQAGQGFGGVDPDDAPRRGFGRAVRHSRRRLGRVSGAVLIVAVAAFGGGYWLLQTLPGGDRWSQAAAHVAEALADRLDVTALRLRARAAAWRSPRVETPGQPE